MLQLPTRTGMTCRRGISHGVKACDSCFRQNSTHLGSWVKARGLARVTSQSPTTHGASSVDECWGVQLLFSVCRDLSRAAKGRLERQPGSTGPSASSCTALGCWRPEEQNKRQTAAAEQWPGAGGSHSLLVLRQGLPVMFLRENISWQCKDFLKSAIILVFGSWKNWTHALFLFDLFFKCLSSHFVNFCIENFFFEKLLKTFSHSVNQWLADYWIFSQNGNFVFWVVTSPVVMN